jgi:hypothetical protein
MNIRDIFKVITPAQAIAAELAEAEMALLKAETGVEWAQASVAFNKQRVKRLKAYVASTEEVKEAV